MDKPDKIANAEKISSIVALGVSYVLAFCIVGVTAYEFSSLVTAVIANTGLTLEQASVLAVIVFGWCGVVGAILYAFARRNES